MSENFSVIPANTKPAQVQSLQAFVGEVPQGCYVLNPRATDAAGNTDETPATFAFTVNAAGEASQS